MNSKEPTYLSELWASINEELNAWDKNWPVRVEDLGQLSLVRDRLCGRTFSDEEIFEGIVKAVLSNATDWSGIQKLLPELSRRFGGFNVAWYSRLTKADIANDLVPWFRSHGAGAQYLERNLNFLVRTAAKLVDRKAQHGDLESYLSGLLKHLNGDSIGLAKALGSSSAHKLDGLGIPIAAEALKNIGYDVGKPDRHINRAFGSFGLQAFRNWPDRSGTKAPVATRTELLSVMYALGKFADHLEVEATLVDNAIWLLCAYSGAYLSNERLSRIGAPKPKVGCGGCATAVEPASTATPESNSQNLFDSGFYCAEAVLLAVAKHNGIESPLIPAIATGFCSGLSRTSGMCGALTGGILGLNLVYGRDREVESVAQNYSAVQRLVSAFESACGSTECSALLGCDLGTPEGQLAFRENKLHERCREYTATATRIAVSLSDEALPK